MKREELLKKIKKIEIASSILAKELFAGRYRSYFKGNGMEFSDIRRYSPGDDVKKIDWKVSARQRKTYVKEFTEEREISIYILVDISASDNFPGKMDLIYQLVGSLALSAQKNGDKVGLILFTSKIEKYIEPKKGRNHAMVIIDTLLNTTPSSKETSIKSALSFLNSIVNKKSIVFLISDFIDKDYDKMLGIIGSKHDLIPIRISDRKYEQLPKGIILNIKDSETGEMIVVENRDKTIDTAVDIPKNILDIYTDDNYIITLSEYFNRRKGVKR